MYSTKLYALSKHLQMNIHLIYKKFPHPSYRKLAYRLHLREYLYHLYLFRQPSFQIHLSCSLLEARKKLEESDKSLLEAHNSQTNMLTKEAQGDHMKVTPTINDKLLLVFGCALITKTLLIIIILLLLLINFYKY